MGAGNACLAFGRPITIFSQKTGRMGRGWVTVAGTAGFPAFEPAVASLGRAEIVRDYRDGYCQKWSNQRRNGDESVSHNVRSSYRDETAEH